MHREQDDDSPLTYAGEYVIGEGGADLYNEASVDSGKVMNGDGEEQRLEGGDVVTVTDGWITPLTPYREQRGSAYETAPGKVSHFLLYQSPACFAKPFLDLSIAGMFC